jgi:hypothetical protein
LFALAEMLQQLPSLGPKLKVALWGDSFSTPNEPKANLTVPYDVDPYPKLGEPLGGLLALLAPLVSDAPIEGAYIHGGLVSYRSLLGSPFLYLPHDVVEPGFLAKMDLDEVARRFAPHHLKMEGLIDGLNRTVDQSTMQTSFSRTTEGYKKYADRLQLGVQGSTDAEVADWFAKILGK